MANCNKCGLRIAFRKLESGGWMPVNIDNSEHWDTCAAERWRQKGGKQYQFIGRTTGKNFKANYNPDDNSIPF